MFRNGVLRFGVCGVLLLTLLEGCVVASDEQSLDSLQGGSTSAGGGPVQACGKPEVHVFGVYEARGDHGAGNHPTGEATVRVERTGPQVLVLSSYEPVRWKVSAVPNAQIQYILTLGYHAQSVEAPPGVPVKVLDYETKGSYAGCAYEYPDDDPHSGCETPELLAKVKELTRQEVSSFHGCYQATSFTLHSDLSADSSCPSAPGGDYNLSGFVSSVCSAQGHDGGQDGGHGDGGQDGGPVNDGGQDGGHGDDGGQTCGTPEVHVFGTYEASGDHTRTGEATVRVERTGSQVLVLSSYESVHWKVSTVPGADLQYILVLGYEAQSVEAPPGVPVKVLDYETKGSYAGCAYEYPDDDPHSGCETPDLLARVKQLTGHEASSFHGCYQATSFTLHSDLSADSSCPSAPGGDYNLSGFVSPACAPNGGGGGQTCGNPEVNVFGVYEASGDHTRTGEATVRVERTGPQVLVLSSYESVRWKVSAVPGADLRYILALGYDAQFVEAPAGVPVKVLDYETKGVSPGCAYEYPDDDPHSGCETPDLLAKVKELTGQTASSFHGCYQATSFTLHSDLSANSSCPSAPGGNYNLSGFANPVCTGSGPNP